MRRDIHARGFTLIELMAVVIVILVLAGITIGVARYARDKVAIARCRSEISAIELALESYKADWGYYPVVTNGVMYNSNYGGAMTSYISNGVVNCARPLFRALSGTDGTSLNPLPGRKAYFTWWRPNAGGNLGCSSNYTAGTTQVYHLMDPFGMPYFYVSGNSATQRNIVSFDLLSAGPDKLTGKKADNIANFQ